MKTKLLLILLSLFVSSFCFGRITFKVDYMDGLSSLLIYINKFDSVSKTETSEGFSFSKGKSQISIFIEKTPKNMEMSEKFFSYLESNGLLDHQDSVDRKLNKVSPIPSALNLELESMFLLNGFTLDAYSRTERPEKMSQHHIYFFSKD